MGRGQAQGRARLPHRGGIDLSGFEFGDVLGEESAIGGPGIPEEDPDPSKDPVSRLGDLWEMGGHLLLVGDSTDPASYARLMGGEEADLIVTDPPYNVAVEEGGMTIENDSMGDEEFRAFLGRAFGLSFAKLRAGGRATCGTGRRTSRSSTAP